MRDATEAVINAFLFMQKSHVLFWNSIHFPSDGCIVSDSDDTGCNNSVEVTANQLAGALAGYGNRSIWRDLPADRGR
jgi:hypothetical protein